MTGTSGQESLYGELAGILASDEQIARWIEGSEDECFRAKLRVEQKALLHGLSPLTLYLCVQEIVCA